MHLEKIKELLQPHIPLRLGKQAVLIFPGEKSQILNGGFFYFFFKQFQ